MEFGKISDASTIDFSFKEIPSATCEFLKQQFSAEAEAFYIGGTGWHMKEWVGSWYPSGTKSTDYLKEYCKQFDAIECNTTFYKIPDRLTIERWRSSASSGFRFCPKVFQGISRSADFGVKAGLMEQFWESIADLRPFLGPVFMQLPESAGVESQVKLVSFMNNISGEIPLFLEFRHPSWFVDHFAVLPLLQAMQNRRFGLVITDVAGRRDVLHQYITCDTVMIRFVSCGISSIDLQRLEAWTERLKLWYSYGLSKVYFFVHDFDADNVPVLIKCMIQKMNGAVSTLNLRLPQEYESSNTQLTLF